MSKGHILVPVERVKELEAGGGVTPYAASQDVAIPLLVDNWNLENDIYKQTVTVRGLDEDSSPIIVLSPVNDVATKEELKAYNCLTNDVIVTDGAITFTAKALPEMSFTVIAKAAAAEGEAIGAITELVAKVETIEDTVETNTNAINSNTENIEVNTNAINLNAENIEVNANAINQLNSEKIIKYNTVSGVFVYYQEGELHLNIDSLGQPKICGTWQLTTSIPKNSPLLIANQLDVTNLGNNILIIPCLLSQGGGAYGTGIMHISSTGIRLISTIDYTYTAGATYAITVEAGTAVC